MIKQIYDVNKVKRKTKRCLQRFLLINSSKIGVSNKVKRRKNSIFHEFDFEDQKEEVKND